MKEKRHKSKHLRGSRAKNAMKYLVCHPKVAVAVILAVVLLTGGGIMLTASRNRTVDNKMTRLGFENIGELATQSAYYSEVSMLENARRIGNWNIPFTQSKYIFTYDGVLKAGINFEQISLEVNEETKTVIIALPEAVILSNELKQDSLKVFDESRSIFTPLHLEDVNEAQSELKAEAEANAIANGLLIDAANNAKTLIRGMLSAVYDPEIYTYEFEVAK